MAHLPRTIEIDFAECSPKMERVYVTYRSFAYEVSGKKDDTCVLRFGGRVENPNSEEKLTTSCYVPLTLGKKEFLVKDLGLDFTPIQEYCNPVPKPPEVSNRNGVIISAVSIALTLVIIAVSKWTKRKVTS